MTTIGHLNLSSLRTPPGLHTAGPRILGSRDPCAGRARCFRRVKSLRSMRIRFFIFVAITGRVILCPDRGSLLLSNILSRRIYKLRDLLGIDPSEGNTEFI